MTFNEANVNREQDGKFGEKIGARPDVSLDGSVLLDNGWKSIRNTEAIRGTGVDKALLNPDGTAQFLIARDSGRVNVTMTDLATGQNAHAWVANDEDEAVSTGYARGDLVFDDEEDYDAFAKYSAQDPVFVDGEARRVRAHLPELRSETEFAAHEIIPGDIVDMEPLLKDLKSKGYDIAETDLMYAESEMFIVEAVELETPENVVIMTDAGNYSVPVNYPLYVSQHDESMSAADPFAYPGEN